MELYEKITICMCNVIWGSTSILRVELICFQGGREREREREAVGGMVLVLINRIRRLRTAVSRLHWTHIHVVLLLHSFVSLCAVFLLQNLKLYVDLKKNKTTRGVKQLDEHNL